MIIEENIQESFRISPYDFGGWKGIQIEGADKRCRRTE